jgi:hypothetical protein
LHNADEGNERDKIRQMYRKFAREEARGRSPLYEQLCLRIADDPELLGFLSALPISKRQPNLFLASVRYLGEAALEWADFRRFVLSNATDLHALMRVRSTQANEAARCAVLLPILASLPGPLAVFCNRGHSGAKSHR